jgi:hypothetical protein
MNDDPLDKLQLQALEARLADAMPAISPALQQQLLYACAFSAGRRAARKRLRLWQAATASLVLLLLATAAPLVRNRNLATEGERQHAVQAVQSREPLADQPRVLPFGRRSITVTLGSWDTPSSAESFDEELARFRRMEPQMRALALGPLTQKLLEQ